MQSEVLALLDYFKVHVKDVRIHEEVRAVIEDRNRWSKAKPMFDQVRAKLLTKQDSLLPSGSCDAHYALLEVCLQTFYNETYTDAPYDACSPYWIIKHALALAKSLKLPCDSVVDLVAP